MNRFNLSKEELIQQDFLCMNHAYLRFFSERFHLIVIDYFARHALVVVQINYVCQTSVEVLLEVEFFG